MNIALVLIVWVLLGAVVSLVIGGAIAVGHRSRRSGAHDASRPATPAAERTFVTMTTTDWVVAANGVATEELMASRPGVIRRVATR